MSAVVVAGLGYVGLPLAMRAVAAGHGPAFDRYHRYRAWVEDAIETMLSAGSLLPAGERFVEGMRVTVKGWPDDG